MQISSNDPDLAGWSGLELLIHEASHEMFGYNHGTIGGLIAAASDSLGIDRPFNLWHAISFYTSGHVMQSIAGQAGLEYTPYWIRSGVMRRAWPEFLPVLQDHWQPYLDGEVSLERAINEVVAAVAEGSGG
jgi:hypothetical protein